MRAGQKHKVLILSGELGDGHKQAAKAIVEAAHLSRPGMEVEIVDFMAWTHPKLHTIGRYAYTQWVTKFPSMYGFLFRRTRSDNTISHLFKKMKFYTLGRMARLLQEVRPTVVVCTFPGAAAAMSMLKENGLTDLPLVTVITDHTDHSYWLHPCTDRYIVGSEHVKEALMGHQIPESRIAVTGIPIRPRFVGRFDRGTLRRKYGLHPDLPTVLVMGGGLGMIGREFTETLRSSDIMETMQVIFVCGQNEKLKQQLDGEFRGCRGVLTTGYVDHIHELMALSDLLITKPGGLTTSEAVAMELPMLLHKPLPGQEQDNAAYLVKSGVAVMAGSGAELAEELVKLIESPLLLSAIRQQAKRHERKHAAFQALEAILATKPTYWPAKVRRAVYARA